ncbi:hypothetical protein SS1G_06324, partial [Sclerotinia sclerotiorum 1980 UF-70]
MLPKVGKKDKTSPRSWRPIALISCIGKGLERYIASQISWTALRHNVISPQHCGALPRRSGTDLTAAFTHDAELALATGNVVSIVTMDVQGAFDALLKRRLLDRMIKQGWPISLLRLIDSFLTNRKVRVRLEGTTTKEYPVACGTPQGSPLSPILYMLYLAELLNRDTKYRFGYADDIAIYHSSKHLSTNARILQRRVRQIIRWGKDNKILFAPEKFELLHITRRHDTTNPPLVRLGLIIPETQRPKLLRPHVSPGCRTDPTEGRTKEEAAQAFKEWWPKLPPEDYSIFSDGSEQTIDRKHHVGYGYAIYRNGTQIATGYKQIHSDSHVFDAEAIGAWRGLEHLISTLAGPPNGRIWMCIDSTSVIWGMRGDAPPTSQWAFHKCHKAIRQLNIRVKWSPGHMEIEGNEEADRLANAGAVGPMDQAADKLPTISGVRTIFRKKCLRAETDWWKE